MKLFFSPRYAVGIGDHVFPTMKFGLVADLFRGRGEFVEPQPAPAEDLLLAHDALWVDKVVNNRMSLTDEARMELPFTPAVSLAHRLSAGGTILACREAAASGLGLHVGGGSHHAFPGWGEGFCVLNDIAIGILKMRAEGKARRAAVIDLDVHHGNGTAAIFHDDEATFTFSMHQDNIYPELKPPSSLDIPMKEGTGDAAYLAELRNALPAVFAHKPDLIVYQAGVDCFERDMLGGLKLTAAGIRRRDELVLGECRRRNIPVAVTLGGGYAHDLRETVALHAATLEAALRLWPAGKAKI